MDAIVLIQFFMWRHKMEDDEFGEDTMNMETMEGSMQMEKAPVVPNVSL